MTLSDRLIGLQQQREAAVVLHQRALEALRHAEVQIMQLEAQLALLAELLKDADGG